MIKEYKDFIVGLFATKKAMLGGQIVSELVASFNITRDYARRILKESVNRRILFSSSPLKFSHGQYAYSTIGNNKSVFAQLLDIKGGFKEIYKLLNVTCLPENEMIKFGQSIYTSLKPEEALIKLIADLGIFEPVQEKTYDGCRFYYLPNKGKNIVSDNKCEEIIQNLKKDAKMCQLIYSYCLNMNLISSGQYRDFSSPSVLIGDEVAFDGICYSSISKNRSNKKTTVLFDVFVAYGSSEQAIKRYIKRSKAYIGRQKNGKNKYVARVINLIVVREINQVLKAKVDPYDNFLWMGIRQLFGKSVDSFLWLIGQDAKLINKFEMGESFYSKLSQLANSDFSRLFSRFLDDYFEIVVNCCFSRLIGKSFLGKEVCDSGGNFKEFDGFYLDDNSVWIIESKNLGKSLIKWESYDSKNRLVNDCLKYFFEVKVNFIRKVYPGKAVYACYVSKSGFSKREESETMVKGVNRFPGLDKYLLKPSDILKVTDKNKSDKEFEWLDKLYVSNN